MVHGRVLRLRVRSGPEPQLSSECAAARQTVRLPSQVYGVAVQPALCVRRHNSLQAGAGLELGPGALDVLIDRTRRDAEHAPDLA